MYTPAHFDESRPEVMQALMRTHPLATVVTHSADGLSAEHIPLHWQPSADGSGLGQLIGHVAQGNPLWKMPPDTELLLVFHGPQHYISPNAYATKASSGGRVVPTWNYVAVHAKGRLRFTRDPQALLRTLHTLTDEHESSQAHAWRVDDAPPEHTERLLGVIVGIEIDITHMQGKWKVSQNQPEANQLSVVQALQKQDTDAGRDMADMVSACGASARRKLTQ